jgi:hypothetical protein
MKYAAIPNPEAADAGVKLKASNANQSVPKSFRFSDGMYLLNAR